MNNMDRRSFLSATPFAVGLAMQALTSPALKSLNDKIGYGALRPTRSRNTGEELLALPGGFEYTAFGRTGAKMSDGHLTPRGHDGMAAFDINGQLRLVRNHEINNGVPQDGAVFGDASSAYDAKAGGGTTTLIIDPKTREIVKDFASLNGTLQNCAGGPTPRMTWISCEETTLGAPTLTDSQGRQRGGFAHSHGYCFEVSAKADGMMKAEALKAMGRFVHEAIAMDAKTGFVYETEDANPGGFYRYLPKKRGQLAAGGRLQMLAVTGRHQFDLRTGQKPGETLPAHWVNIEQPDPADADLAARSVYRQGFAKGGATFARLEGCWYGGNSIFFTATSGGDSKLGQVWQFTPTSKDKGQLKLIYESREEAALDMPDNLCVSPRGHLVICEDGHAPNQFIRGLTRQGQIFDLARNLVPGFEGREFAGATFSPDGQTLFVNVQTPGITFAIWGPWQKGVL
ncbi:MAG: alkaline phosphatase PhoX [Blastocatellia bacterium]